jgi:four helix bundle protein
LASRDYQQLELWQKAHALVLQVYQTTRQFPADERFGLTSQLRRAAVSIPSNIAEGCGRGGRPELARFMEMASGSASEAHYQLVLARDLQYLNTASADPLLEETQRIGRMLTAYRERLIGD